MITDRRSVLAGLALIAATPAAMAQAQKAAPATPLTDFAGVNTASEYYMGVLGPAEASLTTSQLAVERASNKDAHEFAGFELGEAITVNEVLKGLGTKVVLDTSAETAIAKIKGAAKGEGFDRAYIAFQLDNHEYLRDLADAYLHNSAGATDPMEKQGRLLASLMLAVFKEHVAICKRVHAELKA